MTYQKKGSLNNVTTLNINMKDVNYPCTFTFKSNAGGRSIQLSTDGVEYFTPEYDVTTATMLVLSLSAPVSDIKITGNANDAWSLL